MLDRTLLFATLRIKLFSGFLHQSQVDGIDKILDEWERRKLTDLRLLAYRLATVFHETGGEMQPVARAGWRDLSAR